MCERIVALAEKLLQYNRLFLNYYKEVRQEQKAKDFYQTVKPFADEVKSVNDAWKIDMTLWLKENSPKRLNMNQVNSTSDQIEQLSVQAFFPQTSKSRFLNTQRTIEFFLTEVLLELSQKKKA